MAVRPPESKPRGRKENSMIVFETILVMLAAAVLLVALARRLKLPYPVLLAVSLPRRVSVILEGEALLNEASALLIYRLAVMAMLAGGTIGAEAIAPAFLLSLFGSVFAGLALAWMTGQVTRRITDAPSS